MNTPIFRGLLWAPALLSLSFTVAHAGTGSSDASAANTNAVTAQASAASIASAQPAFTQLQEVTVTATRRTESAQKVPLSIEALGQAQLSQMGIRSISDLAAAVPGLQYQPNGYSLYNNYTTVAIRGFNTIVGASTVGIYLDDTPLQGRMSPLGNIGFMFPIIFDLNRVEVLRGPQGTLFGASSEAGAIRFITNQPSLTQFSGYTHAQLGSTEGGAPSYELGAAAGGPILDGRLGFRVSAYYQRDGGYVNLIDPITGALVRRNANSDDKAAFRAAVTLKLDQDLLITPTLFYQSTVVNNNSIFYDHFSDPAAGDFADGRLRPDVSSEHIVIPSLHMTKPLPFADLTVNASYAYRAFDENLDEGTLICSIVGPTGCGSPLGIAYPLVPSDQSPSNTGQYLKSFDEEIRLTSTQPDAFMTWVAGIYNEHRRQEDYQTISASPQNAGPLGNPIFYVDQVILDDQIAIYGQGDLHFTKKLTLTLGAREERSTTNQTNRNGQGFFNAGVPPLVISPTLKETAFMPRVSLSYQATAQHLLYSSISKGLRIGGGNNGLPTICGGSAPATYNADYLWAYELGSKNTFFGGRVRLNGSVFHEAWSQIQSSVLLACGLSYTANLGTAHSDGFDMSMSTLVTDRLSLDLNVGYADARYVTNSYSPSGAPLALRGEAIQALNFVNPPWDATVAAEYSIPYSEGDFYVRGQYEYHSHNNQPLITAVPSSPSYAPLDVADPPTHLMDTKLGYRTDGVDVAFYVNNVFNSHPLLNAYQDTPTSNLVTHSTFRPRTIGISANYSF